MNAVAHLDDSFARVGLTVLRGAAQGVGELLDLELGSITDYGPPCTWLKVPLGKLATERMVPISAPTVTALDDWARHRGAHRPLPHPRTGALTDFLFTSRGRRLGYNRLRNGLLGSGDEGTGVEDSAYTSLSGAEDGQRLRLASASNSATSWVSASANSAELSAMNRLRRA